MDGFACGKPCDRLKLVIVMLVVALATYKHDTLWALLPTVLPFRLQAIPIPPEIRIVNLTRNSLKSVF